VGRENDPFGGDFLEQVLRTQEKTRAARLRRIGSALRVAVPQLTDIDAYRDDRGVAHLRARYEHWRPQGVWQSEDQFSDGTLRVMGLLWAILDGIGPLVALAAATPPRPSPDAATSTLVSLAVWSACGHRRWRCGAAPSGQTVEPEGAAAPLCGVGVEDERATTVA
jgi:hypothetical protein